MQKLIPMHPNRDRNPLAHRFAPMLLSLVFLLSACQKDEAPASKPIFEVKAETIAISGEAPSYLLKKDAAIKRVYKIDAAGKQTEYKAGIDYTTTPNGGLKRVTGSSIPNFAEHKMVLNGNGKFTWRPEPNRNPQLSLIWQVMVDYTTSMDSTILPQSTFISASLRNKLSAGSDLSIDCIGTSITAGAHTLPRYFNNSDQAMYVHLVAKALKALYGCKTTVTNYSEGGATTALFTSKLDYLLAKKPDVVIVEFGMNEHLLGVDMDGNLNAMEAGIKRLLSAGIDCILVGFFQQNPYWELEVEASTIYFNNKLREMATRNGIYFADIYQHFANLPQEKLYRDLMGDYHHHPTEFGHKLYYFRTIPAFLTGEKRESELFKVIQ